MLTRRLRAVLVLAGALGATAVPAQAEPDISCPPGTFWNGWTCETEDDEPPDDERTGCTQQNPLVPNAPCRHEGFEFSAEHDRYLTPVDESEIDKFRPGGEYNRPGALYYGIWEGDPDEGWIYDWRKLSGVPGGYSWGARGYMWLADSPVGVPAVDPAEVAQGILDAMGFEPIEIGLAPRPLEQDPGSIGVVGAPVWMWVANVGPTTWGPLEESATVGGITVTVTAQVEQVDWSMGDGGSVTCTTPGKEYDVSYGVRPSVSCGYRYERTSRGQPNAAYPVRATSRWSAGWTASTGAFGALEVEALTTTVNVRIGERQVIEVE